MSLIDSIIAFFSSLFRTKPKPPAPPPAPPVTPRPTVPPDSATEPAQIVTSKVLVIVYDPVVDSATGKRLSEHLRWSRADDLITNYMDDITETSKGLARYQIVQRVEVDEFLPLEDGFSYAVDTYLSTYRRTTAHHLPEWLDYNAFLARFNILQRVANNELDEVWVFAFPHAGMYRIRDGRQKSLLVQLASPARNGRLPTPVRHHGILSRARCRRNVRGFHSPLRVHHDQGLSTHHR